MATPPSFEELLAVIAAAGAGDASARVSVPDAADRSAAETRCAIALNGMLDALGKRLTQTTESHEQERELRDALRTSEELYRKTFQSSPMPMWVYDTETLRFVAVNEAAVRHYGYTREEFATLTLADIRPQEDVTALRENVARRTNEVKVWRHRKRDGSMIDVEIHAHEFESDGRRARLVLAKDVTEQRKLEEQLRQSQKLEAMGRLAGGVAHDFNNVLSVILSYSELAMNELGKDEPIRADIEEIAKAGRRAADLTRQLLAFSRRQVVEAKIVDLNRSIAGMERMLRRLLGADIELATLPASSLWPIKADPGHIEQIVMNLAVNARDAMPTGGKLTIETRNMALDDEYATSHFGIPPGDYVMLAISDTGVGMDQRTRSRIFEPFFTTKEQGKGTGLGLATVFGIVKQSRGSIWVYSEPGQGATFKLYFPRASGAETPQTSLGPPPRDSLRGTETVLLVEDDDQVRTLARGILRRNGYVVLEAPNAGEALLLCEQHSAKIDLLLTDVVLPRMSGRQLAERLGPMRPEMKVLFMSGYTDDAILQHGVLDSGVAYLQKPITPGSLSRKVREVLDG